MELHHVLVDLRTLQPNPMRDFLVDPICGDHIAALRASIEQFGFWGGVVCRQCPDGALQIAIGHHRVQAALAAGIRSAEVGVRRDVTDEEMLRLYARKNGTARPEDARVAFGTVATVLRLVVRGLARGEAEELGLSAADLRRTRKQLDAGKDLGWSVFGKALQAVLGISNPKVVRQHLAMLKASGIYDRIVHEVCAEGGEQTPV